MENAKIIKHLKKQNDRNETIKHYILGYLLECALKNDVNEIIKIRRLLVYDSKVIAVEEFINSLRRVRLVLFLDGSITKKDCRSLKKSIKTLPKTLEEQMIVIKKFQEFANSYNGIFVNSKMAENSYEK